MCDTKFTLEQLHNPILFTELTPKSEFINGETLYLAPSDKIPILCERVLRNDEEPFIEFTNNSKTVPGSNRKFLKRSIGKSINIYRKNESSGDLESELSNESHTPRVFESSDGKGNYASLPSGGKKYKRKTKRFHASRP